MVRRILVVLALVPLLLGCSAVRPGADGWRLSVVFDDALNLATGAAVKVDGVRAGRVLSIEPDDYRARVELTIDDDLELREGTTFRLRYTTALGELYVDVDPADGGAAYADGDLVSGRTASTAPTVEDTLASASLLVNGGGLGQVQTIVSELNQALDGRVSSVRGVLSETDEFLRQVLGSTRQIDRVLGSLRDASRTLRVRHDTIERALRDLRPAAEVLTDNTDDLVRLLHRADGLAVTADDLVRRTRSDLTVVVRELGPVLDALLDRQGEVVTGLDTLNRFAALMDRAAPADFLNLYFHMHVDHLPLDASATEPGVERGTRPGIRPQIEEGRR